MHFAVARHRLHMDEVGAVAFLNTRLPCAYMRAKARINRGFCDNGLLGIVKRSGDPGALVEVGKHLSYLFFIKQTIHTLTISQKAKNVNIHLNREDNAIFDPIAHMKASAVML